MKTASQIYGEGVLDGFKITLNLCLGNKADGGTPYNGPHTDEFKKWAEKRLEHIERIDINEAN